MKKHGFIIVNGCILDYAEYQEEFKDMSTIILAEAIETLMLLGFEGGCVRAKEYCLSEAAFYNKDLDLEVAICIRKKQEEIFI